MLATKTLGDMAGVGSSAHDRVHCLQVAPDQESRSVSRLLTPIFLAFSLGVADSGACEEPRKLTFEVRVPADEDPDVFGHVYICNGCTPETWPSIVAPEGGFKTRDRLRLTEMHLTPREAPEGVAPTLDMSPAIPGDEMIYTGSLLSIRPIAYRFSSGIHFRMRVLRTTTFVYKAGRVVHELTDSDGGKWILFSVPLSKTIHDPAGEGTLDPDQLDAFAHLKPPYWWTYSSRRLEEDFVVSVEGVADVVGSSWGAAWQRITGDEGVKTSIPVEKVLNLER